MAEDTQPKPDQHRSETLIINATEPLKALGAVDVVDENPDNTKQRVGAYAVRFSGPDEKDLSGEYFTKDTYFGQNAGNGADVMLNHGEPMGEAKFFQKLADKIYGVAKTVKDEIGIFVETVLDLADEYEAGVFKLIQDGAFRWSTGSASHVVKKTDKGEIKRWPIVEVSFTPMACEPRLPKITPLKSLVIDAEARLKMESLLPNNQEPITNNPAIGRAPVDKSTDSKSKQSPPTMSDENKDKKNNGDANDGEPKFDRAAEIKKTREAELNRQREIRELGKPFETKGGAEFIQKAIENGTSVDDFKTHTLPVLQKFNADAPVMVKPGDAREGKYDKPVELKSIGQIFVESEPYKRAAKSGVIGNFRGVVVELPEAHAHTKATLLTSTGPFTNYERPPGLVMVEQQRLTVRDLLPQGNTNALSIRYQQEDTYTNAATTVAEEGQKPEASWDLSEVDAPIRKIAVIGRVSDESFSDFPMLQSYVDQRLRFMLKEREEAQLINGGGTGSDLTGILQTSGIQTQALGTDSRGDAFFKAIFDKISAVGHFQADGIVIHPTDYSTLARDKDANNQYFGGGYFYGPYGNGMASAAVKPIWGLRTVVTTAISAGTALVGAFSLGAMIFDRAGVTVDTTNSDASDFVYNRIAIRVEERLGLVVWRPKAFCKVTGL